MEMIIYTDEDKAKLYEHLKTRRLPYDVSVRDHREKRSINQNSYYYGVIVTMIMNHTGWFKYEVEDMLRQRFLQYARYFNGRYYPYSGHTSDLDTKQMEILCEQIRIWAKIDMNLIIPLPNEPISDEDEPLIFDK